MAKSTTGKTGDIPILFLMHSLGNWNATKMPFLLRCVKSRDNGFMKEPGCHDYVYDSSVAAGCYGFDEFLWFVVQSYLPYPL